MARVFGAAIAALVLLGLATFWFLVALFANLAGAL